MHQWHKNAIQTPREAVELQQSYTSAIIPNVGSEGGVTNSLLWGVLGFIVGAVFWHFIGFWGFVSEVVFVGRSMHEDRLVDQTGANCVQLAIDRGSGIVRPEHCPLEAEFLNEGVLAIRSDFAGIRGSKFPNWSIRLSSGDR